VLAVNEKKGLRRCNAPSPDVFISLPPGNKRSNALPLLARCWPILCRGVLTRIISDLLGSMLTRGSSQYSHKHPPQGILRILRILRMGSARIILAGLRRCPSLPEDAPLTGQGIFGIFGLSCPVTWGVTSP
jgi:hypothetical protein